MGLDILKNSTAALEKYSGLMNNITEQDCEGVYIIDSGRCKIVNSYDNF